MNRGFSCFRRIQHFQFPQIRNLRHRRASLLFQAQFYRVATICDADPVLGVRQWPERWMFFFITLMFVGRFLTSSTHSSDITHTSDTDVSVPICIIDASSASSRIFVRYLEQHCMFASITNCTSDSSFLHSTTPLLVLYVIYGSVAGFVDCSRNFRDYFDTASNYAGPERPFFHGHCKTGRIGDGREPKGATDSVKRSVYWDG